MTNLCSIEELATLIGKPDVSIIDASWYMPAQDRDTHAEYRCKRIPDAVFFDIDRVCDKNSELPHMLPTSAQFGHAVSGLGVGNNSRVIVYDSAGLFSAARVWWMFKVFGHQRVHVLDGGLPAWIAAGNALVVDELEPVASEPLEYQADLDQACVISKSGLIENGESAEFTVLDARAHGRFTGDTPEPRKGLRSGHMPNSVSLPFDRLIEGGRLKPKAELLGLFAQLGITQEAAANTKLVTSCGSGVTASVITLALDEAGFGMHRLYDGAWTEWASAADTIVLTGDSTAA